MANRALLTLKIERSRCSLALCVASSSSLPSIRWLAASVLPSAPSAFATAADWLLAISHVYKCCVFARRRCVVVVFAVVSLRRSPVVCGSRREPSPPLKHVAVAVAAAAAVNKIPAPKHTTRRPITGNQQNILPNSRYSRLCRVRGCVSVCDRNTRGRRSRAEPSGDAFRKCVRLRLVCSRASRFQSTTHTHTPKSMII